MVMLVWLARYGSVDLAMLAGLARFGFVYMAL